MFRYTLKQLEYFAAAAEYGGVTEASKKIYVSPPSITNAISHLETELGVKLFDRHPTLGMILTPEGKKIFQKVRDILEEFLQLNAFATGLSETTQGDITIGCMLTFAQSVFPNLRKNYEVNHPHVQVRQLELNQSEIIEHLRHSKIDVALTYNLNVPVDLTFLPLVDMPPFAVVSDSHPLAKKSEVQIKELKKYPMVLLDLPHNSDYLLSLFKHESTPVLIAERTKDTALMKSLVANNFGFSIVNYRPIQDQSPDGKPLKLIPIGGSVKSLKLGLMMPNRVISSNLLQTFVDYCTESIKNRNLSDFVIC